MISLQNILGGTIRHKPENHAYVLVISSIQGLRNVVKLINGNLRTPKINVFNQLIKWLNDNTDSSLNTNKVDTSYILENAWLSGFIDADRSFDVKVRQKSNDGKGKNRVSTRFRIEQRKTDPKTGQSYYEILNSIAIALNVSLNISIHNKDIEYFIISVTSPIKLMVLINYLEKYPLFSSKFLNYSDFRTCVNIMLSGNHLTSEGRSEILLLKEGMNNKRIHYTWKHLHKLANYL